MRRRHGLLLAVLCGAAILAVFSPFGRATVEACAFDPRQPEAYEADQQRTRYNAAIEAASLNRLLPGDPFFALPNIERGLRANRVDGAPFIPATLMKAIAWVESTMTMASRSVQFDSIGTAQISFDCGHGIMQVTSGMTTPLGVGGSASPRQASIASHFAYNVARGAQILAEKWNSAPDQRPIVGTDTNSDPALIENWYYATWAYNGFTGPGANISNHPLDSSFPAWPRAGYNCDGTQARNKYPYQELVWGCMAHPDQRNGQLLWQPVPATLPNLTDPRVFAAMSVGNWTFPYAAMDIPTPQPAHVAAVPATPPVATALLGNPVLQVSSQRLQVNVNDAGGAKATVRIHNAGTGVLTWLATTSDNFLILSPPAGAAVGGDLKCISPGCPDGVLTVTVNPTLLPASRASGSIHIASPNGAGASADITIDVTAEFSIGAPGTSRAR